MSTSIKFDSLDLQQIKKVAHMLSEKLHSMDVIALSGDLGSGKTTFSGLLINNLLAKQQQVTSPTFNLVHVYESTKGNIWHFDLYRLKACNEVFALGIEEAFNEGISIIEWPEIIKDLLPENTIYIELSFNDKPNLRDMLIKSYIPFNLSLL
jgi:tRNA threonylcarbamoyladenosine biosynthesis protein TsaE